MAFEDELRDFMENRLTAFDPSIDLSNNSTAQVQIIEPLVARFGEDPFAIDIPTFLRERLVQEFPDLAADNAGLLEDLFTKPLQLVLEPFKRAIETANINQSIENAALMSTDEANALGGNFFQDREEGDFSSGPVRVYFGAPTTVRITTDKQFTSRSGLNYFPTASVFIQSSQMLFNREGSLFFVDVAVRAEETGDSYNVPAKEIITLEDVESVVKVANLSAFNTGQPAQTNEEYLDGIPDALTERSLATTRGVVTRVPDVFGTQVRALQVVGGGEEGMNRDILRGTGEGFLHLVGRCSFYGSWIIVGEVVYRDDGVDDDVTIQAGDSLRLILSVADDDSRTVYPAVVNSIISVGVGTSTEKHILILDRTLDTLVGTSSSGAAGVPVVSVFKPGFITISGRPGGINELQTVADDTVHLGGHSDIFVRPSSDVEKETVLPNLTDGAPLLALLDVATFAGDNLLSTATDLIAKGIKVDDAIVIETGASAGSYKIISVGTPDADTEMRVDSIIETAETLLRGRVFRNITLDLVEPKVSKVPFTASPVNDLSMAVGSPLFRLASTDIQSFGAAVGDTIRVLEGPNAGDYLIKSFDSVLGGQGPIVNQNAAATTANVRYEVFTKAEGLEFPLVRIKGLEILDSTNQGTGITVPYGDAVDIRPVCDLEGAGTSVRVLTKDIAVFPDASGVWNPDGSLLTPVTANPVAADEDARYTKEVVLADGVVRTITGGVGSDIVVTEFNVPPFVWNGRNDTIIAMDTREDPDWTTTLGPGDSHRTSDLAEAKVGDSVVILDGPNTGSYTIQDHRPIDFYTSVGHRKVAIIQLDREMAVDPLKTVMEFIDDAGVAAAITPDELAAGLEEISSFYGSTYWTNVVTRLAATINDPSQMGPLTITTDEVNELLLGLVGSGYEVGASAEGTLRVFFQEPVSAEFSFGEDPTFFQVVGEAEKQYRISPDLPEAQIFPQSQEQEPPSEWNRNLVLHADSRDQTYLSNGSAFARRGIRAGDILEYHRAHNDMPARINMQSSWLFVTQAGSNVIRGIYPTDTAEYPAPNNNIPIEEGHLFFVDSGPDIGAYTVTGVVSTDFTTTPASVVFKVDRILTHSTEIFPGVNDNSFDSDAQGAVSSEDNVFPMTFAGGEVLKIGHDTEGTSFVAGVYTFTFGVSTATLVFNTIAELVSDLNSVVGFIGSPARFLFYADGNKLVVRSELNNQPGGWVQIDSGTTANVGALIQFTANDHDGRRLYAVARSGTKRIYGSSLTASGPYLWAVDQWVTIYGARGGAVVLLEDDPLIQAGEDAAYLGTFKVVSVGVEAAGLMVGLPYVEINRTDVFPADAQVHWVRHAIPAVTPADTVGGGKELAQSFVRGRLYRESSERATISIPWSLPQNPLLGVDDVIAPAEPEQAHLSIDPLSGPLPALAENYSHKMPYRILRDGVLLISSTEMETNRDGALYYIDIPVRGQGVLAELNITTDVGLQLEGNYRIDGYTLQVRDEIFVFSEDEQVSIVLPPNVLPVGSTPDLDNRATLAGQNLQVNYDNAELISSIQQFFDSPLDRVVLANALVRHFLPSYVFVDATYTGGNAESTVATEIIAYINNIDPNINEISADEIGKIINQQGATQVQRPLKMVVLTHGVDRRIRGTQSVNVIGGTNLPTFSGTFKQTYFIAGPDTSSEDVRPSGEQVFLDRL